MKSSLLRLYLVEPSGSLTFKYRSITNSMALHKGELWKR